MGKKIGIPRSLFYYKYYSLWKTFFEELGAELVVSDRTSKKILNDGSKYCIDESCLPIKIFHGHVENLKNRVDYIFVPRFTSISKGEYICPKFGGLPDMIRHNVPGLPNLIDTEINLIKGNSNMLKAVLEIGHYFCNDKKRIRMAFYKGMKDYNAFKNKEINGMLPADILEGAKKNSCDKNTKLKIVIIGHVYNISDSFMNMNLISKIKNNNVKIITVEMIDKNLIDKKSQTLSKKIFWNFGRKAIGGVLNIVERKDIDGIVYLMNFGCGIDSFVNSIVESRVREKSNIPYITITLDEHSGDAGMDTRIEAFIDMIKRRKDNENNVSAHGKYIYCSQNPTG